MPNDTSTRTTTIPPETFDALDEAASEVDQLRTELDEAIARRNLLMAAARHAGARVVDIQHATGFASAGAAQAAMARAIDDPALTATNAEEA